MAAFEEQALAVPEAIDALFRYERNHGRSRRVMSRAEHNEVSQSVGRDNNDERADFLRDNGWVLDEPGTFGPRGRPTEGFTEGEDIATTLRALLTVSDYWLPRRLLGLYQSDTGRKGTGRRLARGLFLACLNEHVNTEALGVWYGKDARTIRRYNQQGQDWIRNNLLLLCLTVPEGAEAPLPKNMSVNSVKGGDDMNAVTAEIIERLTRIEESAQRIELRQLDEEERRRSEQPEEFYEES